ncbi:MAG: hypothetical protein ACJ71S_07980, partial [Acidobacteriaceae bacterium]
LREAPVVAAGLDEIAASAEAGELLQEKAAFAASAEAQFANQLFVTGTAAGGAADASEQIAVRGHTSRWYRFASPLLVKRLWGYHLGASLSEKIVDEGCNFRAEVSNMQTKDRFGAGAKIPATLYLLKDGPVQRAGE